MIQEMLLEVCLMMKINQKIIEKLIKVLARLSYKKVHCQPKCKAVFYWHNLNQTKCLTGIVKPKSEKSGLKELDFLAHRRGWLGLGDAIPNKFCPVYTQGGTCSTNCDFNGAPAGFSRLASGNE